MSHDIPVAFILGKGDDAIRGPCGARNDTYQTDCNEISITIHDNPPFASYPRDAHPHENVEPLVPLADNTQPLQCQRWHHLGDEAGMLLDTVRQPAGRHHPTVRKVLLLDNPLNDKIDLP